MNYVSLKSKYTQLKEDNKDKMIVGVKITLSKPLTLNYPDGEKTGFEHTVKNLFFKDNEDPNLNKVCYTVGRCKRKGYAIYDHHCITDIQFIAKVKDYSKNWQRIANSMKKYNINPYVVKSIEDYLAGKTEHIQGFQNYYTKQDKPKLLSFKDITRGMSIPEMVKLCTESHHGNGEYTYFHRDVEGTRRHRSISLQHFKDGKILFTAASEFTGCANGDYYMMFSPTMAFFAERD